MDHVRAQHAAMRLLERHPEFAHANFYTAIVCGDIDTVRRALEADPGLATRESEGGNPERAGVGGEGDLVKRDWGPKGWQPLLYLCFTRLPLPAVEQNAVAIATMLLDRGADPNAYFQAGGCRYTPLVGVIGEGEEGRPGHPQRDALARLLIERGANPYDLQVAYNIHFNGKVLWYLKLVYEVSQRSGRGIDWRMFDQGDYGTGAQWFFAMAIEHHDQELTEWCLAHGADPNARPTLPYDPKAALISACLRSDLSAIRQEIARHPEFLEAPEPLWVATAHDRRDVVELLLDLGMSPNLESKEGERALHIAAYSDSVNVGHLLIERGADVDAIGRQYENTPLGGAMHCLSTRMIGLLSQHSRSAWEVGYAGNVARLRELLKEKPERARGYDGETLLMYLPVDDESKAMEVAELLLAHGADPAIRDPNGATAAERAERNAMYRVAERLTSAAVKTS